MKLQRSRPQCGVGSQGGAEALAIFNELIFGRWAPGPLDLPLARIEVDKRDCSGLIEWGAVRNSKSSFLQNTQEGGQPMSKDRGAEQGNVDGPFGMQFGIVNGSRGRRHETLESTSSYGGTFWKCLVMDSDVSEG